MSGGPRAPRDLAQTLTACAAEGASGIVTVERGKLKRVFCLERGWVVFAASNVLEEQLAELLVQRGTLRPAQRSLAVEQAAREKRKIAEVLLEAKVLSAAQLREAMEEQIEALLSSSIGWKDCEVTFAPGQPRLDGEATGRRAVTPLLLGYARRHPASFEALRVRIGPPHLRIVRSGKPESTESQALDPAGQFVLDRCDGSQTASELAALSPHGEEATLRAIYGLLLAGVVEAKETAAITVHDRRRSEPPLSREEVERRFAMAVEADGYGVLGLDRACRAEQIRQAYYSLARRYHPDRFRSGPLQDLLPRAEAYFTQVTDAYNTLSSPKRRADYDQQKAAPKVAPEAARQSETSFLARQNFTHGKTLLREKRFAEAATFFENAVRLDGTQSEYHLELGLLLARSARRKMDAERHLIAAAELEPTRIAPYLVLGQLYQRSGHRPDAARMFREVLRWDPGNAEASALLAELRDTEGSTSEGRGVLRARFKS